MKLLIVEDDPQKLELIKRQVSSTPFEIDDAQSFKSAQKKILASTYDLILLDMTIPTFDQDYKEKGGKWRSFGGEELLSEMKRKERSGKVFIITGYDKLGSGPNVITLGKLRKKLKEEYPDHYIGLTYFDPFDMEWKDALNRMLKREFKL